MFRPFDRALPLMLLMGGLAPFASQGQYFRQSTYWKTHRQEITVGLGITNFLGELGGRDQIGSPFLWDLEISQTRPGVSLGYRYYTRRQQALRLNFAYGILAGNDNLTNEPFRRNRNLSFKSDVFEAAAIYEFHLYREELGHVYDLRGVKGTKSSRVGFYVFAGIGGFYFDPKAQFNNQWVRLKPLGTEGQGLEGGAEEYSNFGLVIPMGVGIRKALSKQWSVGLEAQYTKTFTDYVDDVSTNYFFDAENIHPQGPIADYLADPSLGTPGILPTRRGMQRGDPEDNDAYLFLRFHVHYKMYQYRSKSNKYRYRLRRQKIVF
jgi:hypothetical protein